jgi:UDP-glucose 4-epimerase
MMKVMIIGSTGYFGRNLLQYLEGQNHHVVDPSSLLGARFDITNIEHVNLIALNVDVIYILAGLTGTVNSFQNSLDYLNTNVMGIRNLLEAISQSEYRPRLIFPSSRLIFKGSQSPLMEDAPREAKTVYASTKIAAEHLLEAYSVHFDIPCTVFRVCVPYGQLVNGPYRYGTVGFMLEQARTQQVIKLFNRGSMRRTVTHLLDVCKLLDRLATSHQAGYEVFNVPGENFSLFDVATAIADQLDVRIEMIEWDELTRRTESGDTIFDGSRVFKRFGWLPQETFRGWVNTLES